ncbi:MAG: M16 family metallopeptidase [Verrucomicrobiaceae bacterium]
MRFPTTTACVETLEPGLDTILDPADGSVVISVQLWVETGSMHESALAGTGISHLLEHMVFKGTDRFTGEALSQEVQAAGGQWNAYTTFDRTVYYIDGPAESLDLFISALVEMVFRPSFPEDEFEKEKEVIRREIAMGLDDPDSVNHQLLFRTAYQKDCRRHPVIGYRDLFDSITYDQMVTYHHARYRPEKSFLVISGGFEAAAAKKIITRELAKGLRPFADFPVYLTDEPKQLGARAAQKSFAIPATHLSLSWQAPASSHPDAAALDLLSVVLGGGRSAPLFREIREKQELAYSIGAYSWLPAQGPGLFCVYAEAEHDKIDDLIAAIHKQIGQLSARNLDHELKRALRQTASQQFKILATASGRASDLASNWNETRNLDHTRDFIDHLAKVTSADLHRVIGRYLVPDLLTTTMLVPEEVATQDAETRDVLKPDALTEHTLSNGVRVILQRDPRIPVVYGNVALLAGCLSETPEKAGLNRLLSTLLLQGTASRSALEIAESLEDLGASIRPSAGNNSLTISSYCLKDDLTPVLNTLGEILREPAFPTDALEREKASLVTRLKEALEDPASLAFRELRHQLWAGKGYGIPSSGTVESLTALNRNDILAHHVASFGAQNLVCAFFGDIDPETTLKLLESTLGSLPAASPPSKRDPVPTTSGEYQLQLDKEQAVIAIGYPGLSATDPDRFALELIHSYCSDMAGPLFTRIREELGLAYFVSSSMFMGVNDGLLAFYLGTAPDQLELARTELMGQINEIAGKGIPEETLIRVKANARAAQALQNQSAKSRVSMAALDVLLGHPADHHLEQDHLMDAVTGDDIRRVAARLLADDHATIVTVSP